MHRREIIQRYIDALGARTYLEIGVQRGHLFLELRAPRKIAVDPRFMVSLTNRIKHLPQRPRERYFELTSDDFFARHGERLFGRERTDVAFIDGLHTYAQVMRGVQHCMRYLSAGGVILLHDCSPASPEAAVYAVSPADARERYPGWASGVWTGDVYTPLVELRSMFQQRNVLVFDTDHGAGCIQPGAMEDPLHLSRAEVERLDYEALDAQRVHLLNLKPAGYLDEAISRLG